MRTPTLNPEPDQREISGLDVTPAETEMILANAWKLRGAAGGQLDSADFIDAARDGWERMPLRVRQTVHRFRRSPGPAGVLLVEGMPLDDALEQTPSGHGSVQRQATLASSALFLMASGLGEPLAYAQEKSGALVQNVVPVPDFAASQSNAGSVALEFHTENAFHPHRPDYVLLMCLRPDPGGVAMLRTASIRRALPLLSEQDRDLLARPWYITEPPPSFGGASPEAAPAPVLTGAPEDPGLRVDFHATRAIREEAARALRHLRAALDSATIEVRLRPGQLAVVDNRVAVHGRSAFQPVYNGQDRWLQRMFVQADLRRSRPSRPGDGHIVNTASDF